MPTYLDGVIVEYLVNGERNLRQGRPIKVGFSEFFDKLMEDLNADAMPIELARIEQVAPEQGTVLQWSIVVGVWRKLLVRDDVARLPERHPLLQFPLQQRLHI